MSSQALNPEQFARRPSAVTGVSEKSGRVKVDWGNQELADTPRGRRQAKKDLGSIAAQGKKRYDRPETEQIFGLVGKMGGTMRDPGKPG